MVNRDCLTSEGSGKGCRCSGSLGCIQIVKKGEKRQETGSADPIFGS